MMLLGQILIFMTILAFPRTMGAVWLAFLVIAVCTGH